MIVERRGLSGREFDRQRAITELLKRYRTAEDKITSGRLTQEKPDELMGQAQRIIGTTTKKRMR